MKKILLFIVFLSSITSINSQTIDELKSEQAVKQDSIDALQSKVDDLQSQIDALPGWHIGAFGTIGGNLSGFDNW